MKEDSLIDILFRKIPLQILSLLKKLQEGSFLLELKHSIGIEETLLRVAKILSLLFCIMLFSILSTVLIIKGKTLFAIFMCAVTMFFIGAFFVMLWRKGG